MRLSNEVVRKIAEDTFWSRLRAQGCDDGEFYKLSGQKIPECLQAGVDEYSKGFRAGYYNQIDPDTEANARNESPVS